MNTHFSTFLTPAALALDTMDSTAKETGYKSRTEHENEIRFRLFKEK
jgi:hypothetical protein